MAVDTHLSLPRQNTSPPRPLEDDELAGLLRIADVLIPRHGGLPAATQAPGFTRWLNRALAARAEKFEVITQAAAAFARTGQDKLDAAVRRLAADQPDVFQPVSAVLAGAYLMIPEVRKAIGYPGQHRSHPAFDLAAEEIMDGILDPVIARGSIYTLADL